MAHFYGTLRGARGETSRLGHKASGIHARLASWAGAVDVRLYHDESAGVDRWEVRQVPHHGAGISQVVATGIVGEEIFLHNPRDGRKESDAATDATDKESSHDNA